MIKRTLIYTGVLALLLINARAFAETAFPGDLEFVRNATSHGIFEAEAGKLAVKNASSEDVKTFGTLMILDHSKLNEQLKLLAKAKEWNLPNTMTTKYESMIDGFSELRGRDFDREYSTEMAALNKLDREEFHDAAKNAADSDLRAWARQVESILEKHAALVPEPKEVRTIIVK